MSEAQSPIERSRSDQCGDLRSDAKEEFFAFGEELLALLLDCKPQPGDEDDDAGEERGVAADRLADARGNAVERRAFLKDVSGSIIEQVDPADPRDRKDAFATRRRPEDIELRLVKFGLADIPRGRVASWVQHLVAEGDG
jgi:hypothetical protein